MHTHFSHICTHKYNVFTVQSSVYPLKNNVSCDMHCIMVLYIDETVHDCMSKTIIEQVYSAIN